MSPGGGGERDIAGTHSLKRLSRCQGRDAAGRIKSKRNFIDSIDNQTRVLSACCTVPQPTAPPHTAKCGLTLN